MFHAEKVFPGVTHISDAMGVAMTLIEGTERAILFGSYARQEADVLSDIDLVVIGGAAFSPTDVFSMAEDLHRATGKAVDVYELCEIDQDSDFYRTILREGVPIAA